MGNYDTEDSRTKEKCLFFVKAWTTHISYWLICHETSNEEGVNVPCLSVLGLFGFWKMTYTPRRREYKGKKGIAVKRMTFLTKM